MTYNGFVKIDRQFIISSLRSVAKTYLCRIFYQNIAKLDICRVNTKIHEPTLHVWTDKHASVGLEIDSELIGTIKVESFGNRLS